MPLPPMHQAHIVLIPKPGKDWSPCAYYRSISLLKCDFKTKTLATRMRTILPSTQLLTKLDLHQERQLISTYAEFIYLQLPPSATSTKVLVVLDIKKAFDSMAWSYRSSVLEVMGFGVGFHRWIEILYNQIAQVKLGVALIHFHSWEGYETRLSPALFALVME